MKEQQFGRTRAAPAPDSRPRERVQVFENRPVQYENTSRQQLGELQASLGGFFESLARAGDTLDQANHMVRMEEIKRENEQQKAQATADALAGNERAIPDDLDYTRAYDQVAAKKHANKLYQDYATRAAQLSGDTDIEAWTKEFMNQEIGRGTGNPVFDAHLLADFSSKAETLQYQFKQNHIKQVLLKGQDNLREAVVGDISNSPDQINTGWLTRRANEAERLFPGEESKAKGFIMKALVGSATTPAAWKRVSSLINEPGYGPNGESYAKLFPEAASDIENAMIDKWSKHITTTGFEAYRGIEDKLLDAKINQDPVAMVGLLSGLEETLSKHGGLPQYNSLKGKIVAQVQKLAEEIAGVNWVGAVATGQIKDFDQAKINKYQQKYLSANGIDPTANEESAVRAAQVVARTGAIADDLKGLMSSMMSNPNDPATQVRAYRFYKALDDSGRIDISTMMSKDAREKYQAGERLMAVAGGNPTTAFSMLAADKSLANLPANSSEFKWNDLMGVPSKPNAEAMLTAQEGVKDKVAELFGLPGRLWGTSSRKLEFHGVAADEIMAQYGATLLRYRNAGVPDYQKAATEDIAKNIQKDYMAIPSADGKYVIQKSVLPTQANGKPVYRPGLITNPATGEVEDSTKTFKADMKSLGVALPGIFQGDLYVTNDSVKTMASGAFPIMRDREPVFLEPGKEYASWNKAKEGAIGGDEHKPMKLPADPAAAAEMLSKRLPDYIAIDPWTVGGKTTFRLMYRFHPAPVKSVAKRAMEFDVKQRTTSPGPTGTSDQLGNIYGP
jgi:hypothetical protein